MVSSFFKTMKFPQLARIVTEKEFYHGILPILVTACSKNDKNFNFTNDDFVDTFFPKTIIVKTFFEHA